ncbi:hypothetical protein Tco_1168549 [Tanacetum coccineum]
MKDYEIGDLGLVIYEVSCDVRRTEKLSGEGSGSGEVGNCLACLGKERPDSRPRSTGLVRVVKLDNSVDGFGVWEKSEGRWMQWRQDREVEWEGWEYPGFMGGGWERGVSAGESGDWRVDFV